VQVDFDGAFASCSAQVIAAKQSGARTVTTRSVASGASIEIESVSASAATCSIGAGNAFAH